MININLIPITSRKDGKAAADAVKLNIPKEVIVGVGVGVILMLLGVHLFLGAIWLVSQGRLNKINAAWQLVVPDKTALDSMNRQNGDLKKKIATISDMTTNKLVFWAPKFNAISDAIPKGLWLRKMTLDKTALTMEGSVVSKNESEINNVGVFLSTLRQNDAFMKDFASLEVNSIQRSKDNTVEVTDFTVTAKLK